MRTSRTHNTNAAVKLSSAVISNLRALPFYPQVKRFIVAYSGGMDSHTLLHCLHQAFTEQKPSQKLIAAHINHGLNVNADAWQQHCQAVCTALSIPLVSVQVFALAGKGQSPEAAARTSRYQALADLMASGDCLLLAQHQNDQAETLLLQLLRGAGPKGLSAMKAKDCFLAGWLARPLLDISQAHILAYATLAQLQWVEDPSNQDTCFDRNFLRHRLIPIMAERWPQYASTLSRSAQLCAENSTIINAHTKQDLPHALVEGHHDQLKLSFLCQLEPGRIRALLRYWLEQQHCPMPSQSRLKQIELAIGARNDANPKIQISKHHCIRRYDNKLYLMRLGPQEEQADLTQVQINWCMEFELKLPVGTSIRADLSKGPGLITHELELPIQIQFRRGGEICRPVGSDHHRSLKKIMQELKIPPWQRQHIPILYSGETIVALPGYFICHPFSTTHQDQLGWQISYNLRQNN